jgi:hypothetical protein
LRNWCVAGTGHPYDLLKKLFHTTRDASPCEKRRHFRMRNLDGVALFV